MEDYKQIFIQNSILTVTCHYILETIILAKNSNLTQRQNIHSHNTRHRQNIDLPQHRLTKFNHTPTYAGSKFYNLLPQHIKQINNNKFINTLKTYLIARSYYTINEFIADHTNNRQVQSSLPRKE